MEKADEVKKIIRSLLVSSALKVTISSLNKDYKDLEGFAIPYKELGYNSLIHFLHSIPDVLRVNGTLPSSEVTLVVSQKTAHVNDLVMKQKRPSKGRKSLLSRKSVVSASPMRNNLANNSSNYNLRNVIYTQPIDKYRDNNSFNYNAQKYKDNSLNYNAQKYKDNSLNYNEQKYKDNRSNYNTPTKTKSVPQNQTLVLQVPKSVSLFPKPILSEFSPPRQQSISKHTNRDIIENSENKKEVVQVEENIETTVLEIQAKIKKLRLLKGKRKIEYSQNALKNLTVTFRNDQSDNEAGIINVDNDDGAKIPPEIQLNLQKLISRYHYGLWCTQLPLEYKRMYGKDLSFEKYGFPGLINLCMTLEHIFYCKKESTYDFKLYDRRNPIPKIRLDVDEELCDIQVNRPQEIDPFTIKRSDSYDWNEYSSVIPEGVFKLGEEVDNHITSKLNVGDRIQIVVSDITDCGKFWIYKDDGILDYMMNSMQDFYRENKQRYLIPEYLLEVGLYCVVYTMDEFQRAMIVDLLPKVGGYVKVFLIDYGTIMNIQREKVWFLVREFSTVPAQAIRAKLANIQPVKGNWSKQSGLRFRDLITLKHVFAKIVKNEEKTIFVYIADNATPLKFINDVLVTEGYAEYNTKESQDGPSPVTLGKNMSVLARIKQMKQMHMAS